MDQTLIQNLLERCGCPVYVFEESVLSERIGLLRNALPDGTGLCFAVKANPFIGRFIRDLADRFEICSPGEMYICEQQGLDAQKYVLSGVHKDEASMRYAFEHGLCSGILTAESVNQFELLVSLAAEYGQKIRVMPRLTNGSQFGMEAEEVIRLIRRCGELKDRREGAVVFAGIHYFSGTQKTSLKKHRRELAMLDDFIDRIREETGTEVPELEYGPGFPAMYFEGEEFDESAYLEEFSTLLAGMRNRLPVTVELGRGIAASCGSFLSRVADVKCNHGENYAILDSGIHHLTYFGQFMAMKHPVCEIWPPREGAAEDEAWNLCGSLCTFNDLLVKKLPVHDLKVGDVIIFKNTGAYCMTEGISLFLSRDLPAVAWVKKNGEIRLLRHAQPVWGLNSGMQS